MKPFLLIEVPCCEINETASTHFIKKFHQFATVKYGIAIKWITRKVKPLFKVKDKIYTHLVKHIKVNVHVVKRVLEKLSETWKYVRLCTTTSTRNQNHQNIYF